MTSNQAEMTPKVHTDSTFSQLSDNQWRFVTAMVENPAFTKKEAAEHIGLKPKTVYRWDDIVNQAVEHARANIHSAAIGMRKQAVLKAVAVKIALLDSEDENIRSKAASEIIDWELGRATQKQEIAGEGGGAIEHVFKLVYPED
jgi:hypothetical protein